jgi:phosphoribosylglycinamide formyltransferase-1
MLNFAVFASGNGGNLQAIINATKRKAIKANLKVVFSDKKDAFALERARKAGIATVYLNPKEFADREAFDLSVLAELKIFKVDFIALAGYMRLLSDHFFAEFPNKIINIHPALLPSFKGVRGIEDAFEYGVKVTGVTEHLFIPEMDAGPIIAQETVAISPKDTLEALSKKIHGLEHKLYPKTIDLFARGKVKLVGRKAVIGVRH